MFNKYQIIYGIFVTNILKMYYQLPDGRIISVSINEYLEMEDEDFKDLVGYNKGFYMNDPHFNSSIKNNNSKTPDVDYIPSKEIPEDILNNISVKEFFDENE